MTKLLNSLVEMPAYLTVAFAIALVSMMTSTFMIVARYRMRLKISKLLKIVFTSSIAIISIVIFYNNQQVKNAKESISVLRDSDVVKITSNSQFLKSAKFKISAENDQYIYVEDDREETIFKIDKSLLKEKTR